MHVWHSDEHPDPMTVAAYVEGLLPEAERRQVEAHLTRCVRCQEEVQSLQTVLSELSEERKNPDREPLGGGASPLRSGHRIRWRRAVGVLGFLVVFVVGAFFLYNERTSRSVWRSGVEELRIEPVFPPQDARISLDTPFRWEAPSRVQQAIIRFYSEDGTLIGQFLVQESSFILPDSIRHVFQPGRSYYWEVEALLEGQGWISSPIYRFIPEPGS